MSACNARRSGRRAHLGILAALAAVVTLLSVFVVEPVQAASTIESHYKVAGSWAVSTANATDTAGRTYVLYYPTNLGAGGFNHPIVTWGNGTNGSPSNYPGVLQQMASWGFVVVASTSGTTGTGTEILAGANYIIGQNANSGSVFYQNIDTTKVGAVGHSQGASGVLNATTKSNGLITSTVPIALPNPFWISSQHKTDFTKITRPVFFLTGTSDFISSPSNQTAYYNQVAGAAAKASLKGAGHNVIQGNGGGYLGYLTAWLMYTLQGDTYARGAFVGSPPEINTNTASWQDQAQKNLP